MTEKQVLEETIAKWNDSVNDISKFKFNSKEVDLFCGMLKRFGEMKVSQALNLTDVVSSYFTSLDIGSKFEIIKNSSDHGFEIGETVTLEALMSADDDEYKFRGKKTYWWCGFAEVKKL